LTPKDSKTRLTALFGRGEIFKGDRNKRQGEKGFCEKKEVQEAHKLQEGTPIINCHEKVRWE